jgi:hypothetical protein
MSVPTAPLDARSIPAIPADRLARLVRAVRIDSAVEFEAREPAFVVTWSRRSAAWRWVALVVGTMLGAPLAMPLAMPFATGVSGESSGFPLFPARAGTTSACHPSPREVVLSWAGASVSPGRATAGRPESATPKSPEEQDMRKFARGSWSAVAGAALVAGVVSMEASAQDAVQWRVEDGGNGHWYALLPNAVNRDWSSAQAEAAGMNATLASISSAEEFAWIVDGVASSPDAWTLWWGPFLGGIQAENSPDSTSGWTWVDGSPWWSAWGANTCGADDTCLDQRGLGLGRCVAGSEVSYNDESLRGQVGACGTVSPRAALVEWSADCNSDGIVDYGQIRAGELEDADANNIPDCCEYGVSCASCLADIDESGAVNAVDLAAMLGVWGTDGGKYPRADIDGSGTVDAGDLAILLNSWGPCQ